MSYDTSLAEIGERCRLPERSFPAVLGRLFYHWLMSKSWRERLPEIIFESNWRKPWIATLEKASLLSKKFTEKLPSR